MQAERRQITATPADLQPFFLVSAFSYPLVPVYSSLSLSPSVFFPSHSALRLSSVFDSDRKRAETPPFPHFYRRRDRPLVSADSTAETCRRCRGSHSLPTAVGAMAIGVHGEVSGWRSLGLARKACSRLLQANESDGSLREVNTDGIVGRRDRRHGKTKCGESDEDEAEASGASGNRPAKNLNGRSLSERRKEAAAC